MGLLGGIGEGLVLVGLFLNLAMLGRTVASSDDGLRGYRRRLAYHRQQPALSWTSLLFTVAGLVLTIVSWVRY
jgi:hypothetical protein